MFYVLYNPLSAHGQGKHRAQELKELLVGKECSFLDVREIKDYPKWIADLNADDSIILAGGDGTLNHFVNDIDGIEFQNDVYYYASGSGNDFYHDVSVEPNKMIKINSYIKDLPIVEVNGIRRRFINGIGYGLDGYCCEQGDKISMTSEKPANYTAIAIKGLLFKYKPTAAKVTVDGKTTTYSKVWIAPTMNGRYYGGGMMVAPKQDRLGEDKTLTTVVFHTSGKLKTLMVFPSIFKGEHVKHTDLFDVLSGHRITVEFDRPTALQIDGETVLGVTSYTVLSANALAEENKVAEGTTV
jgi:diacylglycerol kinase family enzyme